MINIFAYGSNMDCAQMRERCPSARFVCTAKLANHRLAFTRRSINRNCGVADAIQDEGSDVWGVIYEIEDADLPRLDQLEGVNSGSYVRRNGQHLVTSDDRSIVASIYFANPQSNPPLPNTEYKRLIVSGARFWSLPTAYINELEGIEIE
jgi:gamma-glutamylcyclotransferase